MHIILAFHLVSFTGPDDQRIDVNPQAVVTVRPLRPDTKENFGKGIKCLIHTDDGKYVAVKEECDIVKSKLQEANEETVK